MYSKCTTDALKTTSKRSLQKITEATGDLIGNEIDDKGLMEFTAE